MYTIKGVAYQEHSTGGERIDHEIWENAPHLFERKPSTRLVRLSQDPRRKRSPLKLKSVDILPILALSRKCRYLVEIFYEKKDLRRRTPPLSQILLVPMPNPEKSEEQGKEIICSLKYLIVDCP